MGVFISMAGDGQPEMMTFHDPRSGRCCYRDPSWRLDIGTLTGQGTCKGDGAIDGHNNSCGGGSRGSCDSQPCVCLSVRLPSRSTPMCERCESLSIKTELLCTFALKCSLPAVV